MLIIPIPAVLAMAWLATYVASEAQLTPMSLTGGGEVAIRQDSDLLHVSITGPRAGLASLCVGDESRVRILHASAAVGEATYEKSGEHWVLKAGFEWKLRDSARTGPPSEADVRGFLASTGRIANASNAGAPRREFTIHMSDRIRFVGVTFFATAEPMVVSYWPASMDDDCRAMKIAQGFLPESVRVILTKTARTPPRILCGSRRDNLPGTPTAGWDCSLPDTRRLRRCSQGGSRN